MEYKFGDSRDAMLGRVATFRDVLLETALRLKEEVLNSSINESAANMALAREILDLVADVKTEYEKTHDYFRHHVLPKAMEDSGTELIRVTGVGRVNLVSDCHCNCESGKQEELQDWLRCNGFEDLIRPTVNASTLKAWAKARVTKMEVLPPMLKFSPFVRAQLTKG